ncbi:MAG: hypothetical protein RLZZ383_1040 [Pseudomonadota bacterium]
MEHGRLVVGSMWAEGRDARPWSVDGTAMGVTPAGLDALPWGDVWAQRGATDAGEAVNVDEGRPVGHAWLRAPALAPSEAITAQIEAAVRETLDVADAIRERVATVDGRAFTDVLWIGIGGSALGAQLLVDALGTDARGSARGLPITVLDNTDPDGFARALQALGPRLATTLCVVVSKSGGTVEPNNALARVRRAMDAADLDFPARAVAITVPGSALDQQAQAEGWRARLPMWNWVGGRFSITSAVGLFALALAGADGRAFLAGAAAMDAWTRTPAWDDNPAAFLAGLWHAVGSGRGERAMVVLPYADRLALLGRYLQQLVMESVGKDRDRAGRVVHSGLTVYGNKGSTDQHAYVQQLRDGRDDAFAVFVQVLVTSDDDALQTDGARAGDHLQGFLLGTRRALTEAGRPNLVLTVRRLDAAALGGLVALFEAAVGFYASLIGVNAYHQPGVEAGKRAASALVSAMGALRLALREGGITCIEAAERFGLSRAESAWLLARLEALGEAKCEGAEATGRWHAL